MIHTGMDILSFPHQETNIFDDEENRTFICLIISFLLSLQKSKGEGIMNYTAEPIIIRKPSEKLSSLMEKMKIRKREQLENLSKQDCCTFNITLQ